MGVFLCMEVSPLDNSHFLCSAFINAITALTMGSASQKRYSHASSKLGKESKNSYYVACTLFLK